MQYNDPNEMSGRSFRNQSLFKPENLIFNYQDLDQTCMGVGQVLKPHRLKVIKSESNFSARMHYLPTQRNLSIYRLEYSEQVQIEPDYLEGFYLIQIPIQGYAEIECQQHKFMSYVHMASLISPDNAFKMRWHADSPQIILKISKQDFIEHCRSHLPHAQLCVPQFDAKLDLSLKHGHYFLQLLRNLFDALSSPNHPLQHPMAFKQFESSLYNALLYGQPNTLLKLINQKQDQDRNLSPHYIKKVEAYIHEHLYEELSIESLAQYAGVSARTLFNGFKNFKGIAPMAYLKNLRFEQAHLDLKQNDALSITEIAYKWGFGHLGRFSQEYKQRYGELPSNTRTTKQWTIS